jgi:hypothetical protein
VVQQHQRQQAAHLGLVGHQRPEQARQADRLVAEVAPHDRVRARGEIALVEDQVQHPQQRAQPVGQLVVGRHLVRDARVADLALGAHDALLHGLLAHQEGARDLLSREAAERAQRERNARLGRERRVAAGEEQPQAVVWERGVHRVVGGAGGKPLQLAQLVLVAALAAQAVDGAIARRAHDPGAGAAGQAVARPALQCDHERVLDRLLGEVEVAEDADQGRDGPPRLGAEQALDCLLYEAASWLTACGSSYASP